MPRKSRFRSKKGYQQGLQERTEAATGSRGGKWKPIFLDSAKFERWSCKEGDHVIDIIPYLDENDEFQYKLDLLVHQRIGPDEGNYICPKTFDSNADCPLCTARAISQKDEEEELADALRPRDRVVYNIVCYDSNKEENKGIQVWEASNYLAEENFQAAAKKRQKGGLSSKVSFADPDDGRTISFERTGTGVATRYVGFSMEERDEPISDEILDEAHILEDLIDIPSVEVLQEQADIVLSTASSSEDLPDDEEEKGKSTSRKRSNRSKPEDKSEKTDESEKKSDRTRQTRRRGKPSDTGDDVPMDPGNKEEESEDKGEEKPASGKRTARRRSTRRR